MPRLIWSYRKKLQDQGPNPIMADDMGSLLVGNTSVVQNRPFQCGST